MSAENRKAVEIWKVLDLFARGIDGFSGIPLTLRVEGIDCECAKTADPDGYRWRVMLIEEKVYTRRIKKFNADAQKRQSRK